MGSGEWRAALDSLQEPTPCWHRPELWYEAPEEAALACRPCPILWECGTHALQIGDPYGTWGSLTPDDRGIEPEEEAPPLLVDPGPARAAMLASGLTARELVALMDGRLSRATVMAIWRGGQARCKHATSAAILAALGGGDAAADAA